MTSERATIELESIDLAAFLVTAGHEPTIYRNTEGKRAVFSFHEDCNIYEDIVAYERGAALSAKRLLNSRSYLFREASRVVREGRL